MPCQDYRIVVHYIDKQGKYKNPLRIRKALWKGEGQVPTVVEGWSGGLKAVRQGVVKKPVQTELNEQALQYIIDIARPTLSP